MNKDKKYINNQINWVKTYADAEFKSVREAVGIVAKTSELKFEAQNEWRSQMKDQTETFATSESLAAQRDNTARRFDDLNNKVVELQKFNSNLVGKISLAGVIWTLLVIIITWLINKK